MAKLLVSLVLLLLPTSRAVSCNDTLNSVGSLCPSAAFGSQGGGPNLTMLCDDSNCNSALIAINSSCAADPRGQTYSMLLSMCQSCPRAVMQVDRAGACINNQTGPDPAHACTATCQPLFCNAIASCPNGSTWGALTAQQVSHQMAGVRSLLSSCPCNMASTSMTSTSTPTSPATTSTTTEREKTSTSTSMTAPATTSTPTQRDNCSAPFKACGAWGDPHFTKSFYGARFDFMGLGLFTLATNVDHSFELQGFQCQFGGSRAAVFAGFALKVGGSYVTIVGNNVSIDGVLFTGGSHPLGLNVAGLPAHTISLDSHDNCVHFETKKHQHSFSPGFYHNMNINIADSVAALEGVCGNSSGRQPVPRSDALFSNSELDSLCQTCGMRNCVRRLGGRRLEMSAPDDWIPASNASDACKTAAISYNAAALKCQQLQEDTAFFEACIYDFCASDGDESLVQNAIESKQREVARSKRFSAAVTTTVTTTGTTAATKVTTTTDVSLSFAPRAALLSIWATLIVCVLLVIERAW